MKKQDWEKEIRKNVIYDEAELGSPWDIDDLVAYVQKQITKAKEEAVIGFIREVAFMSAERVRRGGFCSSPAVATGIEFYYSKEKYLKSLEDKK